MGILTATVLTVGALGTATPANAAGANRPPIAAPDAARTVSGHPVDVRPLANDKDPEGGALRLASAKLSSASAASASLAVPAAGIVRITPKAGFVGRVTATYVVADSGGKIAQSTITVAATAPANHPPQPVGDKASVVSGGSVVVTPVANDRDPDGDALVLTSAVTANPQAGSAAIASGNRLVVKARPTFVGSFMVRYVVTDARGAKGTGAVLVTVTKPVVKRPAKPNHAPVARPDAVSLFTGSTVRVKVLANDRDADRDRIKLVAVGKASFGRATREGSKVRFTAPTSPGRGVIRYTIRDAHGATANGVLTVVVKARPVTVAPVKARVESALKRLGLPVGSANGKYDGATRRAVCAWRTITGRTASRALPTGSEARAIIAMGHLPQARSVMVTGVTVSVTCQAAFWVGKDRSYRRVMAACSGKPGYRTRVGTFRVFRSFNTWRWSTIYPEARMYKPMQFSGGQALHGSSTDRLVKTRPSSHGCVRMFHRDVNAMHDGGLGMGTKVKVMGRWQG